MLHSVIADCRYGLLLLAKDPRFTFVATADSIFAKVERLCERIYGTAH
jgi:hypothetical protein